MAITMVAAIQKDRGIGFENGLLWKIPEDQKRFKELTKDAAVVMGRLTFESIPPKFRPLKDRLNIVLTRYRSWKHEGVQVVHSLEEALERGRQHGTDVHVIGGEQIYAEALPFADILHLTMIDAQRPADAFFPEYGRLFRNIKHAEPAADEELYKYEKDGVAVRYRFVDFVK